MDRKTADLETNRPTYGQTERGIKGWTKERTDRQTSRHCQVKTYEWLTDRQNQRLTVLADCSSCGYSLLLTFVNLNM